MSKASKTLCALLFINTNLQSSEYNNNPGNSDNNAFNTGINIRCACNNEINVNWEIISITPQQYINLIKKIGPLPIQRQPVLKDRSDYSVN